MNISETEKLLRKLALVDNRNVDTGVIAAWQELMDKVEAEDAYEALKQCQLDPNIKWVEPRHIFAKAKQLKQYRLDTEQRVVEPEGVPCPLCEEHGIAIINCMPCARKL